VSSASSASVSPSSSTPSAGKASPARTRTRSPRSRRWIAIRRRRAVVAEAAHDGGQARERALERGGDAIAHLEGEPAAAEKEGDEHRQRVEVGLGAEDAARREGRAGADDEGEGDADRDRQVHADAATRRPAQASRNIGAAEKTTTGMLITHAAQRRSVRRSALSVPGAAT
jgi:hypothetical protein